MNLFIPILYCGSYRLIQLYFRPTVSPLSELAFQEKDKIVDILECKSILVIGGILEHLSVCYW